MSGNKWSTSMNPLVHVYFFNPVTGIITYEAMRTPGAVPSNSPRLQYIPGQPKPRTLGKDTRGLIEDLVIRRGHAVFFIATPPSTWDPLTNKEREAKIRRAKIQVRKMELAALELDAALTKDDEDEDEPDDESDWESNSSYGDDSFSLSIGDCSNDSFAPSIEESQYSRDSFTTEDSMSADDTDGDRDEDEDSEHQDDQDQGQRHGDDESDEDKHRDDNKNEDDADVRDNVESVTAPVLPSPPSAATSDSLASDTSFATANSEFSPTSPPESPARCLPRYRLSVPKKPSSLRRLTYSASVEDLGVPTSSASDSDDKGKVPSALPTSEIQGEQRSKKRKADDCEDLRTVKKLKMAHSAGTPTPAAPDTVLPRCICRCKPPKRRPPPSAPSTPSPVISKPAAQQQTTSLKRKREDEVDDREASGSSQHNNSDSGPAAKKPKMAPEPTGRRRRRRPKIVRPLARKMWDKLMKTKLVALKLGATFSDFGFLPAKRKAQRPRAA